MLSQLVDALLPGVPASPEGAAYPAGTAIGVDRTVQEIAEGLPEGHRRAFATLLRAVDSPWLNLVLSGRPVRFSRLSAAERQRYLRSMAESRLAVKRKGFQAVKQIALGAYYSEPVPGGGHPLWSRIHYAPAASAGVAPDPLADVGPVRPDGDLEESADVCVIGSGAGGSVIAARLAEAGFRVVVLEAGEWFDARAYPRVEREAHDRLYLGRGIVPTRDAAFGLLAGEAVGGGTAVNWMACLPPLPIARREWAREGGMAGIDGPEFDRAYATVVDRLAVSTRESDVNPSNDALRRGSAALGYREGVDWRVIPRNAQGCRSRCGSCMFGCPYDGRRSTTVTYLADALRAGTRLYASTRAERLRVEGGRARGVDAVYAAGGRRHRIVVRSRAVVVAAGGLQTPALLLRSGVRGPGVGRGLRLDPTTALVGEFAGPVRTWEGPLQTIAVHRFQRSDAEEHGPWIEVAPAHPGLAATAVPWIGAEDHRRLMERLEHVATPIVLVRDVGEGRVSIDSAGRPVFDYTLTTRDRRNLLRGMVESARILRAAGATRLLSLQTPYVEVGEGKATVTEAEFDAFVAGVERAGVREHAIPLYSAHPIGSARAGTDPRSSTARPTGEVHGVEGLWIGDGSLLPSAPGANPMMSILAVAERTAVHLRASLGGTGHS